MLLQNKFLRSVISSVIAITLMSTVITPARASDKGAVILGIVGGFIIADAIHDNRNRQINKKHLTYNNRNRHNRRSFRGHHNRHSLNRHHHRFKRNHRRHYRKRY